MLLKKTVLFLFVIASVVFSRPGFAQEATEGVAMPDTSAVEKNTDEAAKVIPANYQPCELVREFGLGVLRQSSQIAFSPDSKIIYVADAADRRIVAFNDKGDVLYAVGGYKREFYPRGTPEEIAEQKKAYEEETADKFAALMNVSTDSRGNVYAADNGAKVFTPDGKFVLMVPLQLNLQKKSPGKGASGVAVNSRGDIYISDGSNGRIQINDLNGKYKYQITKFKDKKGEELNLVTPGHMKVNSLDEVYVIDTIISRVHRFNAKGNYLGSFGYMGDGAGGFNAPNGIAIDKLDRVYISDLGSGTIQVFSKEGNFLYALCDETGNKLEIPFVNGISVDGDNLIYASVQDRKGSRVKVFKYLTKTKK